MTKKKGSGEWRPDARGVVIKSEPINSAYGGLDAFEIVYKLKYTSPKLLNVRNYRQPGVGLQLKLE